MWPVNMVVNSFLFIFPLAAFSRGILNTGLLRSHLQGGVSRRVRVALVRQNRVQNFTGTQIAFFPQ